MLKDIPVSEILTVVVVNPLSHTAKNSRNVVGNYTIVVERISLDFPEDSCIL